MTKLDSILKLHDKLSGYPQDEVEERLNFYNEMIEDRIEEGFSEEEAVSAVGSVDEVAAQVVADIPFSKMAKEKIKPKTHLKTWEILLLVLGSPIWLSLFIAVVAVIFSLYIALWSVIISLWSVFVSFIGSALGGIVSGIVIALNGHGFPGAVLIGISFVCAGLSIFTFYGCKLATKGILLASKKTVFGIKSSFIKKGVEEW